MISRLAGPADRIVICEGISAREFDGEWVVLDLRGGNYFGLDEVGGKIWRGIDEGKSPSEIAALLIRSYDASEDEVLKDAIQFINELIAKGLVQIQQEPTGRHP